MVRMGKCYWCKCQKWRRFSCTVKYIPTESTRVIKVHSVIMLRPPRVCSLIITFVSLHTGEPGNLSIPIRYYYRIDTSMHPSAYSRSWPRICVGSTQNLRHSAIVNQTRFCLLDGCSSRVRATRRLSGGPGNLSIPIRFYYRIRELNS
jgi:hypothetical protein